MRNNQQVNYSRWLFKLIAWDGVLPAVVLFAPTVMNTLFPNERGAIELTAVLLPIAAFIIRFFVARSHINSNHCTQLFRWIQFFALCVAILILLSIESLIILAQEMPKGAMLDTDADRNFVAVLIAIYLSCMAIAMFPGRTKKESTEDWPDRELLQDRD